MGRLFPFRRDDDADVDDDELVARVQLGGAPVRQVGGRVVGVVDVGVVTVRRYLDDLKDEEACIWKHEIFGNQTRE